MDWTPQIVHFTIWKLEKTNQDLDRTQAGMQTGTYKSNCIPNKSNSHPEAGGEERSDPSNFGKWCLDWVL